MVSSTSIFTSLPFLLFIFISHFLCATTLEIIIGGGGVVVGGAPPSPPPEGENCQPPPPPPPPPQPPCPPPSAPPRPPSPPPPPHSSHPRRPPPPPPTGPFAFESELLRRAYPVIQAFKNKVKQDPDGIIKTWKGPNICRDYIGFICDIVPDRKKKGISGVNFNHRNLGGPGLTLADFIDRLPDLAFFHANSNFFTGSVPTNITTLRYLSELDLSNNKLSGSFPNPVLRLPRLVFLDIRFNTFSGSVPPQVFNLALDLLFINNNNFLQNLPDNLGSTPVLYLSLANNKFTGQIPRSIGRTSNTLLEVLFLNNQLSGCLPYEIGLLKKTTVFDVGSNQLTGPIPKSFQCLQKMELFNLARNNLYGPVPEAVCSLPHLTNFSASYNFFTQVGAECRKLINKGVLDVKMNCIIDLPNQRSPSDCTKFFSSHQTCPDEKSLAYYVPCAGGTTSNYLESSDLQAIAPAPISTETRAYTALSPHN